MDIPCPPIHFGDGDQNRCIFRTCPRFAMRFASQNYMPPPYNRVARPLPTGAGNRFLDSGLPRPYPPSSALGHPFALQGLPITHFPPLPPYDSSSSAPPFNGQPLPNYSSPSLYDYTATHRGVAPRASYDEISGVRAPFHDSMRYFSTTNNDSPFDFDRGDTPPLGSSSKSVIDFTPDSTPEQDGAAPSEHHIAATSTGLPSGADYTPLDLSNAAGRRVYRPAMRSASHRVNDARRESSTAVPFAREETQNPQDACNDFVKRCPEGVLLPPPHLQEVIEKVATYVGLSGPIFEKKVQECNAGKNNKTEFIEHDHEYNAYYRWRVAEHTIERGGTYWHKFMPSSAVVAEQRAKVKTADGLQHEVKAADDHTHHHNKSTKQHIESKSEGFQLTGGLPLLSPIDGDDLEFLQHCVQSLPVDQCLRASAILSKMQQSRKEVSSTEHPTGADGIDEHLDNLKPTQPVGDVAHVHCTTQLLKRVAELEKQARSQAIDHLTAKVRRLEVNDQDCNARIQFLEHAHDRTLATKSHDTVEQSKMNSRKVAPAPKLVSPNAEFAVPDDTSIPDGTLFQSGAMPDIPPPESFPGLASAGQATHASTGNQFARGSTSDEAVTGADDDYQTTKAPEDAAIEMATGVRGSAQERAERKIAITTALARLRAFRTTFQEHSAATRKMERLGGAEGNGNGVPPYGDTVPPVLVRGLPLKSALKQPARRFSTKYETGTPGFGVGSDYQSLCQPSGRLGYGMGLDYQPQHLPGSTIRKPTSMLEVLPVSNNLCLSHGCENDTHDLFCEEHNHGNFE